jgi:predicted ATPase/DNA-binding winged helix-turn-helix (wHTH) protein
MRETWSFGPFRLLATERLLERNGVAVPLSSRALDILIALVERAGEVVGKDDLIARAWPTLTVDESSLRVQIAALRKALGEGGPGARYVTNVPGRGYCFVASVTHSDTPVVSATEAPSVNERTPSLPPLLTRMVGRDVTVRVLCELLASQRFVTIHGPGGIGKTTVAVAVGHAHLATLAGAVYFCDLGSVGDPRLVSSAVASALALVVQSDDPTSLLINVLRDRPALLILDSCEHVIEAAAALAERIFRETQHVKILATSREYLEADGEHVHRLPRLDSPPAGTTLTAAEVLSFPAAHLFVERAAAGGSPLGMTDLEAPLVADICRKLDGIALAIELAAGRVSAHGLHETAALLDNRLKLLWRGRRTALPRHQTLKATLDWSYDLIDEVERIVLRRLSVFIGPFGLQAAQAVAADSAVDEAQVAEVLARLVSKSLVSVNVGETIVRYRLLDTTRDYARAKLDETGETETVARQHAAHYRDFLNFTNANLSIGRQGEGSATLAEHLGNVRAALGWCFSERGEAQFRVELAAAAARYFLALSLPAECHQWSARALSVLGDTAHGGRLEMELQAGLGQSLMVTKGNSEQAQAALDRALALADEFEDRFSQFRIVSQLHLYHRRRGHFSLLVPIAERAEAIAVAVADPVGIAGAHGLLGVSATLVGNQAEARVHLETSLRLRATFGRVNASHFAFHRPPQIPLARTLWLQGFPDQAVQTARISVAETAAIQDAVSFCIALIWGESVFQWAGDWATVDEYTERLIAHATRQSLEPYVAVGHGLKGEALVKRGDAEHGIVLLRGALASLHAHQYELYTADLNGTLAEGLAMVGRGAEALAAIDEAIAQLTPHGDVFNMPELLRVRGEVLAQTADAGSAEECFRQSIAMAERHGALSWRLRTTMSLARLHLRLDRREEARTALAETYAHFEEGFDTADLKAAKVLLDEIGGDQP